MIIHALLYNMCFVGDNTIQIHVFKQNVDDIRIISRIIK